MNSVVERKKNWVKNQFSKESVRNQSFFMLQIAYEYRLGKAWNSSFTKGKTPVMCSVAIYRLLLALLMGIAETIEIVVTIRRANCFREIAFFIF